MSPEAKGRTPYIIYEEQRPGLPEEFEGPDGLRCLRTGPVSGGIFRHPAEDWISGSPKGPNRMVQLATIFVYDPKAGEVRTQKTHDILAYFRIRREFQDQGWQLVPACLYRIVGYRELKS